MEVTNLPGVGPATKTKLNDAGIFTILDLATAGPADIADATDVDITKAVDLNNKARKKLVEMGRLEPDFISASELLTKRKNISRLSTGSKNLDELLSGAAVAGLRSVNESSLNPSREPRAVTEVAQVPGRTRLAPEQSVTQPNRQVLIECACHLRLRLQQLALVVGVLVGFRGHLVELVQRV